MLTQQTCQILLIKGRKTRAVSSQLVPLSRQLLPCAFSATVQPLSPLWPPHTRHSWWASAVIPWGASQGNRCPRAGQKPVMLSCEPVNHTYSHQYNARKRNRAGREQSKGSRYCSCYARLLKWSGVTILGGPIMQGNSHVPDLQPISTCASVWSLLNSTVIIMSSETKFMCCGERVCLCYCSHSGAQACARLVSWAGRFSLKYFDSSVFKLW